MDIVELPSGKITYRIFGEKSDECVVIETALASSCAEWWHIAQEWSSRYSILVYDRLITHAELSKLLA
jgi:hypothetical protein